MFTKAPLRTALAFLAGIILAAFVYGDVEAAEPTNPWADDSTCPYSTLYTAQNEGLTYYQWAGGLCSLDDLQDKVMLSNVLVDQFNGIFGVTSQGTALWYGSPHPCAGVNLARGNVFYMDFAGLALGIPTVNATWFTAAGPTDTSKCQIGNDAVSVWEAQTGRNFVAFLQGLLDSGLVKSNRNAAELVLRFYPQSID